MTELSLIVPCYNEAQNVDAFYDRCLQVFEPAEFEVIFVNDGSKDDTYKKLQHLHEEYSNVLVVNFSRNFGKEAAIYAGLHYATGTYLSIIDADLQQDPEIVKHMTEILEKKPDVDVVAAYQKQRHEGKFMAWCKDHFYRFINRLSEVDLREMPVTSAPSAETCRKHCWICRSISVFPKVYFPGWDLKRNTFRM